MQAHIKTHNDAPAITVNGEIFPPMMATIRTSTRTDLVLDEAYFRALGQAGLRIFFLICDTEWLKPGAIDLFRREAETLLAQVPDAYIIPRVGLHPPNEWMQAHPDTLMTYSDGSIPPAHLYTESYETDMPGMYGLWSDQWRQAAGQALLDTCSIIWQLPYADRIIGTFLAAGGTSEWYPILPETNRETGAVADCSPAFRRMFGAYLKEKYGSLKALRQAWQNPDVTFTDPPIPSLAKRFFSHEADRQLMWPGRLYSTSPNPPPPANGTNIGTFLNVDAHQDTADFFRAWHIGIADSTVFFANLLKQQDSNRLVGSFYGSYGCTNFFGGTAGGVLRILDSGSVDFLAAPGVYENRQPGGYTGQREMQDSFRLRHCIFITEDDTRTHMEVPFYQKRYEMYDSKDTCEVLKRDFGRNICEDIQGWWFDQHIGGGRYKHPDVYALFTRQQQLARYAYTLNRQKGNEIALIYDEESISIVSHQSTQDAVEIPRNYETAIIGAPVDYYFHNDMAHPAMPDYKLYVFCNTWQLSDSEKEKIRTKLKKNNALALWMYAPGLVNPDTTPKLSAENISALTGIRTRMLAENVNGKFKINGTAHPLTSRLDPAWIFGDRDRLRLFNSLVPERNESNVLSSLYPMFYADDPQAIVLAKNLATGLPALAYKETDGFRSLYCNTKLVRNTLLREVARHAGCHLYCETDDVLYANKNFVTLHAASSGQKQLCFPDLCRPFEVYEEKTYGTDVDTICFPMLKGETKMFCLQGPC